MSGMEAVNSVGISIIKAFQGMGATGAAIAFTVGALYLMLGGDTGRQKAKGWFIGGAVGLVILMGCLVLAETLQDKIAF